jgi:DNA-directed RNA polymerase subunit RPC12/RpoP
MDFEKFEVDGVDLAYRCLSCGKLTFQTDILHGIGCRKCGSMKIYPISDLLTTFGLIYCLFWNWVHGKINTWKYSKQT